MSLYALTLGYKFQFLDLVFELVWSKYMENLFLDGVLNRILTAVDINQLGLNPNFPHQWRLAI